MFTELTRANAIEIAQERQPDGQRRWEKIGHALCLLDFAHKFYDESPALLMVRHKENSYDNVKSGMLGPVAETMAAVALEGALWRPETTAEVATRSLKEELGLDADALDLSRPDNQHPMQPWTMRWPMTSSNDTHPYSNTYAVCSFAVAGNPAAIEDAVVDDKEVMDIIWMTVSDIQDVMQTSPENFRPGVAHWFDRILQSLNLVITTDTIYGMETLRESNPPELLADLRFNDPATLKTLGIK